MDMVEDSLRAGMFTGTEKKRMENLAQWHFQNCMRMVVKPGIPKCVRDYVYGYRKEPTIKEISDDYQRMREFFRQRQNNWERKTLMVAIPATILMIIGLILLLG